MTAAPPASVAVCIATYRRPVLLGSLLRTLADLRFPSHRVAPSVMVIVVDNDFRQTARETVEEVAGTGGYPWRLLYEAEPEQNIALARNRAVARGMAEGADFFAFVDDDETVRADWLDQLLLIQQQSQALAVGGAVVPRFSDEVPAWVKRGGFFDLPRHPTHSAVSMAFTGNSLLKRDVFDRFPVPFDADFGRSGGEDSHFFMKLRLAGVRIVWADDAVTEEFVPASRATMTWLVRRAFRIGTVTAATERALLPRRRWLVPRILKGGGRLAEGTLLALPSSLVGGRAGLAGSLRKVAHGAGCLAGIAGMRFREYEVARER